jgi:hypothetical protein
MMNRYLEKMGAGRAGIQTNHPDENHPGGNRRVNSHFT